MTSIHFFPCQPPLLSERVKAGWHPEQVATHSKFDKQSNLEWGRIAIDTSLCSDLAALRDLVSHMSTLQLDHLTPPHPSCVGLHVRRTSTARRCCCWRCPPSRSAWTWSWAPLSSCVTRSSASRWPSTSSSPNEDPSGAPCRLQAPQAAVVVSISLKKQNVGSVGGTPRGTLEQSSVRNSPDYKDDPSRCFFTSVLFVSFLTWHLCCIGEAFLAPSKKHFISSFRCEPTQIA